MTTDSTHLTPLPDAELEARIVAWVAGEASPFEAAELTRILAENPELALFKRRLEAVHGLVAEAVRPDGTPLRLAPDRRAKLLQALGATEAQTTASKSAGTVVVPMPAPKKKRHRDLRWLYATAACLTVGLFTLMSIPVFQKVRSAGPVLSDRSDDGSYKIESRADPVLFARYDDAVAQKEAASSGNEEEARKQAMEIKAKKETAERDAANVAAAQTFTNSFKAGSPPPPAAVPAARQVAAKPRSFSLADGSAPLSPFEITASEDKDYSASQTLAGNRLRTDLHDVGSAVTVVTNKFLKDVAATDNQTLLQYTTGTEVGDGKDGSNASRTDSPEQLGLILGKHHLAGLDANSSPADDKVVLSPFEVSANTDAGYRAESTLAGKRVAEAKLNLNEESFTDGTINPNLDRLITTDSDPVPTPRPVPPPTQSFPEVSTATEPVSTFSLHVSDVSFRLAQAALANDQPLDLASIRPEEFYNAFSYGDPTPVMAEKVSCRIEQAAHPFAQQRNLVRIAVKVAASGRAAAQPLHLTVLLDTSGSMEREDRAATVHSAMQSLFSLLGPNDRLTLIGFARSPRLLAEAVPGDQTASVLDLIKHTPAEGGTNLEAALALGRELAQRQFDPAAQNRLVLLTDGAANLGNADPAQLAATVEELRQQKIAFDACGVGLTGLDDGMLENLTRQGDGRYYVLNSPAAADATFAHQLAGAFRPAAENVKLQVRFNPARVGHYRLIGFEQHRLREEDFRNDRVDAAELAAEEAAVAVYQVEALPQGEGELGEVYVRFRDTATGDMVERNWTLAYDAHAPAFDRATPSLQLAGTAALLAEALRGGEAGAIVHLGELAPVVNRLRSHYAHEARVQEFATMFEQARKLAGE